MELTNMMLSFPYIEYKIGISHFTARKSTVIEWVILEAINKCEKMGQYGEISIASFFEQIFTVTDADLMIRPCLLQLFDIGAINLSGIDDTTELSKVFMKDLKLTELGREMQEKGLLPGVLSESSVNLKYDVVSDCLITEKEKEKVYKEKTNGKKVIDISFPMEINAPLAKIKDWVMEHIGEEQKGKMNWFTNTTEIKDISIRNEKLLWKSSKKGIDLGEGLIWKVIGNEDESVDEVTLKKWKDNCPKEFSNLPLKEELDFENIDKIMFATEITPVIKEGLGENIFFCHEKYYEEVPLKQTNKQKKNRMIVLFGCEEFSVQNEKEKLLIKIPGEELLKDGIYYTSKKAIQVGRFLVRAGKEAREMTLAYTSKKGINLANELVKIVDAYVEKDNSILFILYELGLYVFFLEYVEKIISDFKTVKEKWNVINTINKKGKEYYYTKKVVSNEDEENLLMKEDYIVEKSKTILGAKEVLQEYGDIPSFKQKPELFHRILKLVLETIGTRETLEDIWVIWETITKIQKSFMKWINKEGLYKEIYSKEAIDEIICHFDESSFLKKKDYTSIEQIIGSMQESCFFVQKLIPEINIFCMNEKESLQELLISHKEMMKNIYTEVCKWKEEEKKVSVYIMDIEELCKPNSAFSNARDTMGKISEILEAVME